MGLTMSPGWVHLGWSPCELSNKTDVMIFRKPIDMDPEGALCKEARAKGIVLPEDAGDGDLESIQEATNKDLL